MEKLRVMGRVIALNNRAIFCDNVLGLEREIIWGGWGVFGDIDLVERDVGGRVGCKGTGAEKDQYGAVEEEEMVGLEGTKGKKNHCGWDFIYSGEEEGQLVGQSIFYHDRGSVFSRGAGLGFRVGVS